MTVELEVLERVSPVLVAPMEQEYVLETPVGLVFREDTPREVWANLIGRLLRQQKRVSWAIADAINFGERRYGDLYAQWVNETGLAESTLATIAWVGRAFEPPRRRADIDFSHHREVAALPAPEADALLEQAAVEGWSRMKLRGAVSKIGRARTAAEQADPPERQPARLGDLVPEARRALTAASGLDEHPLSFQAGAIWAWQFAHDDGLFKTELDA